MRCIPSGFALVLATISLSAGCGGSGDEDPPLADDTSVAEVDTDTDTEIDTDIDTDTTSDTFASDTGPGTTSTDLHGEVPAVALTVPTFTQVLAMDDTSRSSVDLVGQPTVLWFYPAAFTGG